MRNLRALLILISLFLISCGEKQKEVTLSRTKGFRITHYSVSGQDNWIKVSGTAIFRTNYDPEDDQEDNGRILAIKWFFDEYRDQFGRCNGIIEGVIEQGSLSDIYQDDDKIPDVNDPYNPNNNSYLFLNSEVKVAFFFTPSTFETTGCPFPLFNSNNYALFYFQSGQLYITDSFRGLDYRLIPN